MVSARLLFNDKWVRVQLSVPIANAIRLAVDRESGNAAARWICAD
jgi:hypothetical protein